MRNGYQNKVPSIASPPGQPWLPDYPNPPDLRFNYFKLLNDAQIAKGPIAQAPTSRSAPTVAIVGAGIAGLTVARELWRAGYTVSIFEASDRIGGRLYTVQQEGAMTAYEMGAMRMPFFNGSSPSQSENCLLAYYLNRDQTYAGNEHPTRAEMMDFPNPGTAPGNTGIYMDGGYGPDGAYTKPTLTMWPAGEQPDNADLRKISDMVNAFVTLFTNEVAPAYVGADWSSLWKKIANNYDKLSFSDLVFTPAIGANDYQNDGWFGGLGMNEAQSKLFYTIGSGDGSWGAFYSVGAMWFIRCVMFGYNSNLQSVSGLRDASTLPHYEQDVRDSRERLLSQQPLYSGIQSLSELMLFLTPPGSGMSLYDACRTYDGKAELLVSAEVAEVKKTSAGFELVVPYANKTKEELTFDQVVIAAPIWAAQLSIRFTGFDAETELPWSVPTALAEQHLIASCKVFFPLNAAYWKTTGIPQVLVTDTFLQDAYGVQWGPNIGDAALLASYTWEDDATKLLATPSETLAERVLDKLEDITQNTLSMSIRPHIKGKGTVFHWTQQPSYRGCAKLYRQRNWSQCYELMTYNQRYSKQSGLYFAGESYGTEGGWTEPALRTALDAVIHLVNNTGGRFLNEFSFDKYPKFDNDFLPKETYPQTASIPPAP